jgi:hypothetical protein
MNRMPSRRRALRMFAGLALAPAATLLPPIVQRPRCRRQRRIEPLAGFPGRRAQRGAGRHPRFRRRADRDRRRGHGQRHGLALAPRLGRRHRQPALFRPGRRIDAIAAGTVLSVTVVAAGWLLSAAGEVICLIPNALGESLLYNERLR